MATIQVPVVKAKGQFVEIDTDKIPENVYAYIITLGSKAIVNRGTSTKKDLSAEEYVEIAKTQVEGMYSGKTRIIGQKTAKKRDGVEMTEAVRIAKETVKQQIKAAGGKISHYSAAEITRAAKAYVEADPETYLATARENLARAAGAVTKGAEKMDIMSIIKPSEAKVAKVEAKAAERKAETSAAKAGKVIPTKAKPAPRPHA